MHKKAFGAQFVMRIVFRVPPPPAGTDEQDGTLSLRVRLVSELVPEQVAGKQGADCHLSKIEVLTKAP